VFIPEVLKLFQSHPLFPFDVASLILAPHLPSKSSTENRTTFYLPLSCFSTICRCHSRAPFASLSRPPHQEPRVYTKMMATCKSERKSPGNLVHNTAEMAKPVRYSSDSWWAFKLQWQLASILLGMLWSERERTFYYSRHHLSALWLCVCVRGKRAKRAHAWRSFTTLYSVHDCHSLDSNPRPLD